MGLRGWGRRRGGLRGLGWLFRGLGWGRLGKLRWAREAGAPCRLYALDFRVEGRGREVGGEERGEDRRRAPYTLAASEELEYVLGSAFLYLR